MSGSNKTYNVGHGIASVEERKFDAQQMHHKMKRKEEKLFDDGTGVAEVWRIEDFELVPQPAEVHGVFFGGDSYVILYTYKKDRKEQYVVYYWLVSSSDSSFIWHSLLTVPPSAKAGPWGIV